MEASSVVSSVNDHIMTYSVMKSHDARSSNIPMQPTSDAVTLPTRRQMNSVKNQFEGKYFLTEKLVSLLL